MEIFCTRRAKTAALRSRSASSRVAIRCGPGYAQYSSSGPMSSSRRAASACPRSAPRPWATSASQPRAVTCSWRHCSIRPSAAEKKSFRSIVLGARVVAIARSPVEREPSKDVALPVDGQTQLVAELLGVLLIENGDGNAPRAQHDGPEGFLL